MPAPGDGDQPGDQRGGRGHRVRGDPTTQPPPSPASVSATVVEMAGTLGAVVVWCGLRARRVRPRDHDAGPSAPYFANLGFTLVALVDAFLVIVVLDLGAPGWALATTGVVVAGIGHIVLRVEHRRLVAPDTHTRPPVTT